MELACGSPGLILDAPDPIRPMAVDVPFQRGMLKDRLAVELLGNMTRNHFLNLALAAAVSLAGAASAAPGARLERGEAAPAFTGTTLDGRKISLSDYRGKSAVVLNFYADFCAPCRQEFPRLKELHEKYGKSLAVIAVSLDEEREAAAGIPNQHRVRFPVLFDPKGAIAERYGVQAIPHTVVIEKNGTIHTILVGLDLKGLDRAVEAVVK